MCNRFDVNNRELNRRRFNDQYAHIVQVNKHSRTKTKFRLQEVSLTLTPPGQNDLSAENTDQKVKTAGDGETMTLKEQVER